MLAMFFRNVLYVSVFATKISDTASLSEHSVVDGLLLRRKSGNIDPIIYGWFRKVFMEVQQSFS